METTANSHITIDSSGVARIDDSRMKVIHVIKEMRARGSSPEQLRQAFSHLSMSQIHAALAYYYDHQAQIDSQIDRELREFDEARAF
jgi:uncharacterized protein (DUF433 family)